MTNKYEVSPLGKIGKIYELSKRNYYIYKIFSIAMYAMIAVFGSRMMLSEFSNHPEKKYFYLAIALLLCLIFQITLLLFAKIFKFSSRPQIRTAQLFPIRNRYYYFILVQGLFWCPVLLYFGLIKLILNSQTVPLNNVIIIPLMVVGLIVLIVRLRNAAKAEKES